TVGTITQCIVGPLGIAGLDGVAAGEVLSPHDVTQGRLAVIATRIDDADANAGAIKVAELIQMHQVPVPQHNALAGQVAVRLGQQTELDRRRTAGSQFGIDDQAFPVIGPRLHIDRAYLFRSTAEQVYARRARFVRDGLHRQARTEDDDAGPRQRLVALARDA